MVKAMFVPNRGRQTNKNFFFWVSAISVALLSILASLHSAHPSTSDITTTTTITTITSLREMIETVTREGTGDVIVSLLRRVPSKAFRGHHPHHRKKRKIACDEQQNKWKARFASDQNAALILTVDLNGCANFSSVQKAVDAVPDNSATRTLVIINSGVYREKVVVSMSKANITFQGQGYLNTSIAWNDTANSTGGTFYSASVSIFAQNFIAYNISFQNTAPPAFPGEVGGQAVALRISGDQAAFYGCGFYGGQDTLHDDQGRHYFRECFIQGSIDFIFGNAKSLYEDCRLHSIARPVLSGIETISGAIAAHGRQSMNEQTGFAFLKCIITGTGKVWLGRAWGPYSSVIYARTYMSEIIAADGWNDWNDPSKDQTIFFGEYECMGPGANLTLRAMFSKQLTYCEAAPFMDITYIDGNEWLLPLGQNSSSDPPDHRHHRGYLPC